MQPTRLILFFSTAVLLMTSCKKEDPIGNVDNIPGLGGDTWVNTNIDRWIYDSLTVPYNMAVKYKWDQFESLLNATVVPPKEEKIIPTLSAIKQAWIIPYIQESSLLFFKQISPKFFYLLGSSAFFPDGSQLLGVAEGGRKVVLFNLNSIRFKNMPGFVNRDTAAVLQMFNTIHHEYAHILDQTVDVPIEFSQTSASGYTSDWTNVRDQEALNEGFITPYGNSSATEDWAEMVSHSLVNGRAWFDNLVNSINYTGTTAKGTTAATARARLRQKEAVMVSYFQQTWGINFYSLQSRTREAISRLLY